MKKMNTPHKWVDVIKAWADGKIIQHRSIRAPNQTWIDFDLHDNIPAFNSTIVEWRIKPEPKLAFSCRLALMKYPDINKNYIKLIVYEKNDMDALPIDRPFNWDYVSVKYSDYFVKWVSDVINVYADE